MNTTQWPCDKVLRLPDWCFGRRWLIGLKETLAGAGIAYHIMNNRLPDVCVLWEFEINCKSPANTGGIVVGVRLNSQVPVSDPTFQTGDRIFPNLESPSQNYQFRVSTGGPLSLTRLKMPIVTANRFLTFRIQEQDGLNMRVNVLFVISSLPKEVPDWVVSGMVQGK